MKNLINTLKIIPLLLLLITVSCKKESSNPGPEGPGNPDGPTNPGVTNSVSINDLENYYIVTERKNSDSKLGLMYFTKEANVIKANLHGRGYLRISDATVNNSKLSFDVNSDGKSVYTFEFEKDGAGNITLRSAQYKNTGDATQRLAYAILAKKSESPDFKNSSFNGENLVFKLNNSNKLEWDIKLRKTGTKIINGQPFPILTLAPEFTLPYYSIIDLGFKTNNDEIFGISVPKWNGVNTPLLLTERVGMAVMSGTKQ